MEGLLYVGLHWWGDCGQRVTGMGVVCGGDESEELEFMLSILPLSLCFYAPPQRASPEIKTTYDGNKY